MQNNPIIQINKRIISSGKGTDIILVHGMGGHKVFTPLVNHLSAHFRVHILIFPGFLPEDGKIQYTDDYYIEFLENVRLYLQLDKMILLGLSMGGRTVLNYTIRYPNKVSQLILSDAIGLGYLNPVLQIPGLRNLIPKMVRIMLANPKMVAQMAARDFTYPQSSECQIVTKWFTDIMRQKSIRINFSQILQIVGRPQTQWPRMLPTLNMPVLLLWGGADQTAPLTWGQRLHALIPGSQMHEFPQMKHMALMENSAQCSSIVQEFLQ